MNFGTGFFGLYWILLIVSGGLLLALAGTGFGSSSKGTRVVNLIFGTGLVGYGLYLGFFFTGTHYVIFFQAFILPVAMIANAFRGRNRVARPAGGQRQPAPWQPPAQGFPAQPNQWPAGGPAPAGQWPTGPAVPQQQWPAGGPVPQQQPWPASGPVPQQPWPAVPPVVQPQNHWQPAPPASHGQPTADDILGR
jgi:hypothetical protein